MVGSVAGISAVRLACHSCWMPHGYMVAAMALGITSIFKV